MELNFQNFYAFEFTLGIIAVIGGFYFLQISLFFIISILSGSVLVLDAVLRWNKSQRNKEDLQELELDRINTKLDFDIKEVIAEKDIDWYPDDIKNGMPIAFNEMYIATYKIELIVYNPSVVKDVIKNIEVEIINQNKKADTKIPLIEDVNRMPVSIEPRTHKKLIFQRRVEEMEGNKGDRLKITLSNIDNKKTRKEYEIKHYYIVGDLKDIYDAQKANRND